MTTPKNILAIGTDERIIATVIRLINNNPEWNGTGANSAAEAVQLISNSNFDVVLFGAGLTADEERDIEQQLKTIAPATPCVKHFGGGSGLLFCEIYQALGQ